MRFEISFSLPKLKQIKHTTVNLKRSTTTTKRDTFKISFTTNGPSFLYKNSLQVTRSWEWANKLTMSAKKYYRGGGVKPASKNCLYSNSKWQECIYKKKTDLMSTQLKTATDKRHHRFICLHLNLSLYSMLWLIFISLTSMNKCHHF